VLQRLRDHKFVLKYPNVNSGSILWNSWVTLFPRIVSSTTRKPFL
jgi:hypothetical protein